MENKELYERAKRRVKARMGFYTHLGIYAAVNVVLFAANWNETGTYDLRGSPGRWSAGACA